MTKHWHLNRLTQNLSAVIVSLALTACSSDDSDSGTGYLLVYNASPNAPELTLSIESEDVSAEISGMARYTTSTLLSYESGNYELELAMSKSNDTITTFYDTEQEISSEDVTMLIVTGDITSPQFMRYQYEYEDPDTEDEQFTLRFLNLKQGDAPVDVYMSLATQDFNEATLVESLSFEQLSESHYFDLEEYTFYLTDSGSDTVLYQSADVPLYYTNQQLIVINPHAGPGDSVYSLDKISSTGSVSQLQDTLASAKLKVYNAMDRNELLSNYDETFSFHLSGIDDSPEFTALNRYQMSAGLDIDAGDYSMDITTLAQEKLTNSQILSLPANSDKTVFFYLSEVTEEDDDDESLDETTLYVNSLITDNNSVTSPYSHEIQVVNFVEDYASVVVYFVSNDDTVSTTPHKLVNSRAVASKYNLSNGQFDVFVLAQSDSSDILLTSGQLDLDEASGNLYLVIEQEDKDLDQFSLQFLPHG